MTPSYGFVPTRRSRQPKRVRFGPSAALTLDVGCTGSPSLTKYGKKTEKGLGGALKDVFFGESDEEVAARQARERDAERRREEFINNERARREEERKRAAHQLREARAYEVKLRASITEATEKLAESQTQRGEASANLVRTQDHLKRLADDKIELV